MLYFSGPLFSGFGQLQRGGHFQVKLDRLLREADFNSDPWADVVAIYSCRWCVLELFSGGPLCEVRLDMLYLIIRESIWIRFGVIWLFFRGLRNTSRCYQHAFKKKERDMEINTAVNAEKN